MDLSLVLFSSQSFPWQHCLIAKLQMSLHSFLENFKLHPAPSLSVLALYATGLLEDGVSKAYLQQPKLSSSFPFPTLLSILSYVY